MIWDTESIPKSGEKKYKVSFAFLPKKTCDKKTVWLERYIVEYNFYNIGIVQEWGVEAYWSRKSHVWKKYNEMEN